MPNINQMMGSKYLKKEDVGRGMLVTITGLEQQQLREESGGTELKWICHFREIDRPMVMNPTNLQLCAIACGSEETDNWIGRQVVLFNDPTVSMGGKLVGGIRIRAPRPQQQGYAAPQQQAPQQQQPGPQPIGNYMGAPPRGHPAAEDDEIPFFSALLWDDPIFKGLRWGHE